MSPPQSLTMDLLLSPCQVLGVRPRLPGLPPLLRLRTRRGHPPGRVGGGEDPEDERGGRALWTGGGFQDVGQEGLQGNPHLRDPGRSAPPPPTQRQHPTQEKEKEPWDFSAAPLRCPLVCAKQPQRPGSPSEVQSVSTLVGPPAGQHCPQHKVTRGEEMQQSRVPQRGAGLTGHPGSRGH
ncbi:hypothetical protein GHT09_006066 [Marmota monax]|uniref:Uncharacterized protein n=1 Tax=Marmota monax TaxID=9995 RepID=A0A834PSA5_MARMO|nr:hypothetical protein GHT09_006066 [Marmota monax]